MTKARTAQWMRNWMCLNTAMKLIFATVVTMPAPAMAVSYAPASSPAQPARVFRSL